MNQQLRIWGPVLTTLALVLVVRYAWVQPAHIGHLCNSGNGPWWCAPRHLLVLSFATKGLGYTALGFGVLALFSRNRGIAIVAACVGMGALVLYNYELGAVSVVLSVLTLARLAQPAQTPLGH